LDARGARVDAAVNRHDGPIGEDPTGDRVGAPEIVAAIEFVGGVGELQVETEPRRVADADGVIGLRRRGVGDPVTAMFDQREQQARVDGVILRDERDDLRGAQVFAVHFLREGGEVAVLFADEFFHVEFRAGGTVDQLGIGDDLERRADRARLRDGDDEGLPDCQQVRVAETVGLHQRFDPDPEGLGYGSERIPRLDDVLVHVAARGGELTRLIGRGRGTRHSRRPRGGEEVAQRNRGGDDERHLRRRGLTRRERGFERGRRDLSVAIER